MSFEERFFGPGNRLRWEAIRRGELKPEASARLQPFIDELVSGSQACALPRILDDDSVYWYILSDTARGERVARDEIRAFVGPSYSTFDGQTVDLDPTDPVESAVIERCGIAAFRVEVPSSPSTNNTKERVRERLSLWLRLRREQPVQMGLRIRPTGRILRDFEYALSVSDGISALACIDELRTFGRLDGRNLLFLEVRRLASLLRWREIRELREFDSLLAVRRPHRVTEAIIAAIYVTELEPFEREGKASEAVEHFRQEISPRFADLYRSRRGLTGDQITASFVLAAMAQEPRRPQVAATIVDGFAGATQCRTWLEAITRTWPSELETAVQPSETLPASLLESARSAFAVGDLDRAVELAGRLPHSVDQAMLLLRCAREVGTIDSVRNAFEAVNGLEATDRSIIENNPLFRRLYAELGEFAGDAPSELAQAHEPERIPASWSDWLGKLTQDNPWPVAVAVAELGAREWSIEPLSTDPTAIEELAELISASRPGWGEEALRDASPYLIEALLGDGPRASRQAVYDALLLLLLTEPNPSLPTFRALIRLLEARLTLAVDASLYADLVDGVGSVLGRLGSPAACESALDALETLISQPCASRPAIEAFVGRVVSLFSRWYRRVDTLQRALLAQLAEELGLAELVTASVSEEAVIEVDPLFEALQRSTLALYSLNERALTHVTRALEHACSGINVNVFHDHVGGSPALRAAASTADVFVIAPAAAKHAATTYIADHRPKTLLTLYARGQGSAGMLAVLRESAAQIQKAVTPGHPRAAPARHEGGR